MKERIWIAVSITLLTICYGCSFFQEEHKPEIVNPIKILVYADKINIATKVTLYMVDNPNLIIIPTADVQMLNEQNIMSFSVVILLPVSLGVNHFPGNVLSSLRDFVRNGGGIIGMHDILFLQDKLMYEIFGGSAGVFPTDAVGPIYITTYDYSPITHGIPERFTLIGEHTIITKYNPTAVHCLFDMSYRTTNGETKKYCTGWSYRYGKGKVFFFAPGHAEVTRYNPYFIRMISNAVFWMVQDKD